jgi:sugar lactone lactonase YvrE
MIQRPAISPVVWQPPPAPPRALGRARPTLPPLKLLYVNGLGPEDVALDGKGQVVTGVDGGRILRLSPDGRSLSEVAETHGRPLGIELYPDGRILVCDAYRGLLQVDPDTSVIEVLADRVSGEPMQFCAGAAVASDGTVYFSDASRRFGLHHWKADLMEHSGTGRLLRRSPDGAIDVLLDGLQLANGVALTSSEDSVLVAETGAFRIVRYWLTGEKSGTSETLIETLPGYPFGMSLGGDGLVWVAIASPRNKALDTLASRNPALRKILWAMPERVHPNPQPSICAMAVDPGTGVVVHDLYGPPEHEFHVVTGVVEREGTVYMGSIVARAVAAFQLGRPPVVVR